MKSTHRGIYKVSDSTRSAKWCWERRINGKRKRTFFYSLEEAISCKRTAENLAKSTGADIGLMFDAKAQKEYLMSKEIVGEVSLVDVALFYRDHKAMYEVKFSPIKEVVAEVLGSLRRGITDKYISRLTCCLSKFAEKFEGRQLSTIKQDEIMKWLNSFCTTRGTALEYLTKITYLFKRAKTLGYLKSFDGFDKSMIPKEAKVPIEVYSKGEIAEILQYAHKTCPVWLPNIALRCFVGLRTAEASKMCWEWIDMKRRRILVPAEVCKTRDEWVLQTPNLPETVFKWLELVPKEKRHGKIPCPPKALGRVIKLPLKTNGFRHTFCTMHISLYGSADKTATLLKHKGTSMLYKHYLGKLVPEDEAKAYFNLTPQSLSSNP